VGLSETSHINYLLIKTYKFAEQMGSYMPNPTREEYGSTRHRCVGNVQMDLKTYMA
jgi:hypothetical protein